MNFITLVHTTLVVILTTSAVCADGPVAPDVPRLRYTDSVIKATMSRGAVLPAFAALVRQLEGSDVILFIERDACRGYGTGRTQFITAAGDFRYARITLNIHRGSDPEVALLGHELQHAVELARAPAVRDIVAYRALYEAIGEGSNGPRGWSFETSAAREMGFVILQQLHRRGRLPNSN